MCLTEIIYLTFSLYVTTNQYIIQLYKWIIFYFFVCLSIFSQDELLSFSVKSGKVFYGKEPPSGESTTTECGVNYQLK